MSLSPSMRTDEPFGQDVQLKEGIAPGLDFLDVHAGYMAVVDIETDSQGAGHHAKRSSSTASRRSIPRIRSGGSSRCFKKITPNFVQFNKLPAGRLQGVVTRVEM